MIRRERKPPAFLTSECIQHYYGDRGTNLIPKLRDVGLYLSKDNPLYSNDDIKTLLKEI